MVVRMWVRRRIRVRVRLCPGVRFRRRHSYAWPADRCASIRPGVSSCCPRCCRSGHRDRIAQQRAHHMGFNFERWRLHMGCGGRLMRRIQHVQVRCGRSTEKLGFCHALEVSHGVLDRLLFRARHVGQFPLHSDAVVERPTPSAHDARDLGGRRLLFRRLASLLHELVKKRVSGPALLGHCAKQNITALGEWKGRQRCRGRCTIVRRHNAAALKGLALSLHRRLDASINLARIHLPYD